MIQELIYTSAERGLHPGSRGFCTVACTEGMSKPLVEQLESLSGYRHLFPPGTPEAVKNPIAQSVVKATVGGQDICIVSRVADLGLDYTGRSNKIAHHIVVESDDMAQIDPMSILHGGYHTTKWVDEPSRLPKRSIPHGCHTSSQVWNKVLIEMGWAEYLQSQVERRQPVNIVYPLGTDVLNLLAGAQAALGLQERWNMTFSTFYTRLPPSVQCLVRCVPNGTKEAAAILARVDRPFLNLADPNVAPRNHATRPRSRTSKPQLTPNKRSTVEVPAAVSGDAIDLGIKTASQQVESPNTYADLEEELTSANPAGPPTLVKELPKRRRTSLTPFLIGGVALAVLTIGAAVALRMRETRKGPVTAASPHEAKADALASDNVEEGFSNSVEDADIEPSEVAVATADVEPEEQETPEESIESIFGTKSSEDDPVTGGNEKDHDTRKRLYEANTLVVPYYFDLEPDNGIDLEKPWKSFRQLSPPVSVPPDDTNVLTYHNGTRTSKFVVKQPEESRIIIAPRLSASLANLSGYVLEFSHDGDSTIVHITGQQQHIHLDHTANGTALEQRIEHGIPLAEAPAHYELQRVRVRIDGNWTELNGSPSQSIDSATTVVVARNNSIGLKVHLDSNHVHDPRVTVDYLVALDSPKPFVASRVIQKVRPGLEIYRDTLRLKHELLEFQHQLKKQKASASRIRNEAVKKIMVMSIFKKFIERAFDENYMAFEGIADRFEAISFKRKQAGHHFPAPNIYETESDVWHSIRKGDFPATISSVAKLTSQATGEPALASIVNVCSELPFELDELDIAKCGILLGRDFANAEIEFQLHRVVDDSLGKPIRIPVLSASTEQKRKKSD